MTEKQINNIIEQVARQFDTDGVRYTPTQLGDCIAGYARLLEETGTSDAGQERAASILVRLVDRASSIDSPWEWVASELRFEAQAEAMGDRALAALNYLRYQPTISDQELDVYNERVSRFSQPTDFN